MLARQPEPASHPARRLVLLRFNQVAALSFSGLAPPRYGAARHFSLGLAALLVSAVLAGCTLDTQAQGAGSGATDAGNSDGSDGGQDVTQTCLPSPGQKSCDNKCVERTDPAYGCDTASCAPCALSHATATCTGGACAVGSCDPGYLDCNGQAADGCEVYGNADPNHCGDCNTDCTKQDPTKQWQCNAGQCQLVCPAGKGDCNQDPSDGCEADLATDANNCGACGRPCSAANGYSPTCNGGLCTTTCNYGWGDCQHPAAPAADDGCETSTLSDKANCGACGAACSTAHSASETCSNGNCTHTCQAGWSDCNGNQPGSSDDGCQTHTDSDPDHCGSCNRPCSGGNVATRSCQGGVCNSTCKADWGNCRMPPAPQGDDGCETYVRSDQNNCGGCGRSCSTANAYSAYCAGGLCVPACKTGFADCTSPAAPQADDGCECNGHCSGNVCK